MLILKQKLFHQHTLIPPLALFQRYMPPTHQPVGMTFGTSESIIHSNLTLIPLFGHQFKGHHEGALFIREFLISNTPYERQTLYSTKILR